MIEMTNKRNSIMSKGWLIIGVVMLITGACLFFLANSLYYESNQLEDYINNGSYDETIKEVANHISTYSRFLVIASLVVIIIGAIMCMEWILFSKFLQRYKEK